jgi:hypothetical protein
VEKKNSVWLYIGVGTEETKGTTAGIVVRFKENAGALTSGDSLAHIRWKVERSGSKWAWKMVVVRVAVMGHEA